MSDYLSGVGIPVSSISELPSYVDQNFLVQTSEGKYVVKIANSKEKLSQLQMENQVMDRLTGASKFAVPQLFRMNNRAIEMIEGSDTTHPVRLVSFLRGSLLSQIVNLTFSFNYFGRFVGELHLIIRDHKPTDLPRKLRWDLKEASDIIPQYLSSVKDTDVRDLIEAFLTRFDSHIEEINDLPQYLVHNDLNDNNVFYNVETSMFGVIDFGDMVHTFGISELVIALAYLILERDNPMDIIRETIKGYYAVVDIKNNELKYLLLLIAIRYCMSICISSHDSAEDPDNEYILISQKPVITMLRWLATLDDTVFYDPLKQGRSISVNDHVELGVENPWKMREQMTSSALSLSYFTPLTIVRGRMQYLYDESGRAYLDLVNNVPLVGHANPRVVERMLEQASLLNTNTRYLHPIRPSYFAKLQKTLPAKFSHIFYVNSGTEANELAIRLASTYTKSNRFMVLEDAYHGNSNATVDLSPYKFLGPGGKGKPDHVTILPRGTSQLEQSEAVYEDVRTRIDETKTPASFVFEPIMGVAGQFFPSPTYLQYLCEKTREIGGLCIADEVQIGFGRLGSHFWGFEYQNLSDHIDMIVVGKPMGNGFPVAAVITTKEIADAFDNGMEFFSTFGGNPLSVAVADAVLDEVIDNKLQQHAAEVGKYFVEKFKELAKRFPVISDVRGSGLFIGVELADQKPRGDIAQKLVNYLLEYSILLSIEGPDHNVLKIKPPLPIDKEDIDNVIAVVNKFFDENFRN